MSRAQASDRESALRTQQGALGLTRSVALVGLMGAGKSSVGRRLAKLAQADFTDADEAITAAAGMTIPEIFRDFGEPAFRDLERRVVARLIDGPPLVLALGGGAFIDPQTRLRLRPKATTIWLRADLETLLARTLRRRGSRPLLADDDPRETLARLMAERYPIYAEADHAIDSGELPAEGLAEQIWALVAAEVTGGGPDLASSPSVVA